MLIILKRTSYSACCVGFPGCPLDDFIRKLMSQHTLYIELPDYCVIVKSRQVHFSLLAQ
jgi:hypothetical protein